MLVHIVLIVDKVIGVLLYKRGSHIKMDYDAGMAIVNANEACVYSEADLRSTVIEPHLRLHNMDSLEDHAPVAEAFKGFIPQADLITGEWKLVPMPVSNENNASRIISGSVAWVQGLYLWATPIVYMIEGVNYQSDTTYFALNAADATYDRIDVVYVATDGLVHVATGIAEENPLEPILNTLTQLKVTSILVEANATEPSVGIVQIYDENIEWTTSYTELHSGETTVDFNSTLTPYKNSKHIAVYKHDGQYPVECYLNFVGTSTLVTEDALLVFQIFSTEQWFETSCLRISFKLSGAYVGSPVYLYRNNYDNHPEANDWGLISIPIGDFNINTQSIDELEIYYVPNDFYNIGNYMFFDDIHLQLLSGGGTGGHLRLHTMTNALDHAPAEAADYDKLLASNASTGAIEFISKSSVGTTTFLGLTDTPADYTGQGGKVVSVKNDVSGLEFTTVNAGVTPTDYIFDWDAVNNYYKPYDAKKGIDPTYPYFYTGTDDPTFLNRLNMDGEFYASRIFAKSNTMNQTIRGQSTNYAGLSGISDSGYGVSGDSGSGVGVFGNSSSNHGVQGRNASQSIASVAADKFLASTNTVIPAIRMSRQNSSGVAQTGQGVSILFENEVGDTTTDTTARIEVSLTDVTSGQDDAKMEIFLLSNGSVTRKLSLSDIGKLTLDTYGDGTHTGTATKFLAVDTDGNVIEENAPSGQGVDTFLELTDAPDAYTSQGGKVVSVKVDESGLEFTTPSTGASSYLDLTDTSDTSYTNKDGFVPMVNEANTDLDLVESIEATFLLMSDTPTSYVGSATKHVVVNASGTGLEFQALPATNFDGMVDDISFEFRDITAGTAQTYDLDIKASYLYTIESASLETDNGTLTGVAIKINGTAVTSLSSLTVDTAVDTTSSTGAKSVLTNDRVTLVTSTGFSGAPNLIRGKLTIART